jgi:hypothetical protein
MPGVIPDHEVLRLLRTSGHASYSGDDMARTRISKSRADPFAAVKHAGLTLPHVEVATRYDGAPMLKLGGAFMAALATHESAEPDTLVVRVPFEEREWLLEDAPETYYLTDYYRPHPTVLVRLSRIGSAALRDLLLMSWRTTQPKARLRAKPAR